MSEIIVAGAGSGDESQLTHEVHEALMNSDVILASSRFRKLIPPDKRIIDLKDFDSSFNQLEHEHGNKLILLSGDPCLYSLLPVIKKRFPNENIRVLPGISSLQILCAHANESWTDSVILSGHGRALRAGVFLNLVERNKLVILFCDTRISPQCACVNLLRIHGNIEVFLGCSLGSENEQIFHGKPEEFLHETFPELSVMLIKNHNVYTPVNMHIRDSEFLRVNKIVMTNECVRSVILSRLNLNRDLILWDIGAGSGSISISAGHENIYAEIHAVEYKHEAAELISRNASRFHTHNIIIHEARALDVIDSLSTPTHIFIGGTEGELAGILEFISRMKEPVYVMIACVTLETFNTAYNILKDWKNFDAVQISVSESKNLNSSMTLINARTPVMLISASHNV
ncbi:MAG: precorrin-6y C5,15-methyltransferase (decarboxylating) subunit CbiE [Synergistaceae bacterium]|nr:precorrin-6y C5,15-methyltransferase (decarboxylating) subunit CbiE [Synergistaceae bacterium]